MDHQVLILGSGPITGFFLKSLLNSGFKNIMVLTSENHKGPQSISGGLFKTYHLNKGIADLCIESHNAFTDLSASMDSPTNYFAVKPTLSLVPPAKFKPARAEVRRLQKMGVSIEMVSAKQAASLFPGLQMPEDHRAIVEHNSGTVAVEELNNHLQNEARAQGVVFKSLEKVESLRVESGRIKGIVADQTFYEADLTVLTDDQCAYDLLNETGIDLCLHRSEEQSHVFQSDSVPSDLPNIVDYSTKSYIGQSLQNGQQLIGGVVTSAHKNGGKKAAEFADLLAVQSISKYLPQIQSAELISSIDHFSIRRDGGLGCNGFVPGFDGLYAVMGWGGEAFKVAPAVAREAVQQLLREQYLKSAPSPAAQPAPHWV